MMMMTQASPPSSAEEVGPTEEVVKALLEYFVDPLLPLKPSAANAPPPPLSQQQNVAKQLHAVVLLYNHYHREQHPKAEYLDLVSFSKLVVTLKPALVAYMKSVHGSDSADLNGLENQLSVTEKAVMDACNISRSLEVLRDVPSVEGWPISKVAVLLVDSSKENCFLLFSSTTEGVWSVIEQAVDHSSPNREGKRSNKRKRNCRKQSTSEQNADESAFQQLAFSAVKEASGIDRSDLKVLERHVTYSLSKEKTSACFYIMQCTRLTNQEFQAPVRDTIESLQGTLVKRSFAGWTNTQVIEYYHVLPYAGIMSSWFSREFSPVSLQSLKASSENTGEKEVSESGELVVKVQKSSILELGDMEIQRSKSTENPFQCGSNDESYNRVNSSGQESPGVKSSKRQNREVETREKSDSSCDVVNIGLQSLIASTMENTGEKEVSESGKLVVKDLQSSISEPGDMEIQRSKSTEIPFQCGSIDESYNCANSSGQEGPGVKSSMSTNREVGTREKSDRSCDVQNIGLESLKASTTENTDEKEVSESGKLVVKGLENSILEPGDMEIQRSKSTVIPFECGSNCECYNCANSCGQEDPGVKSSKSTNREVGTREKSDRSCDMENIGLESLEASTTENTDEKEVSESGKLVVEGLQNSILEPGDMEIQRSNSTENPFQCRSNDESANFIGQEGPGVKSSKGTNREVGTREKSDRSCDVENIFERKFTEGRKDYLDGSQNVNVKEMAVNVSGSQMAGTLCPQGLKEELMEINVSGSQKAEASGDREANKKSSSCHTICHGANPSDEKVNCVSSSPNGDEEVENGRKADMVCEVSESSYDNQISESSKFFLSVSQNSNVVMGLQSTEKTLLKEVNRVRTSTDSIGNEASGVNISQRTEKEAEKFSRTCDVSENSCEEEITESKTAFVYGVQDSCIESENLKVDDSSKTEDPHGMEIDEYNYSDKNNFLSLKTDDPRGNEASATIISQIRDKEVENRDKSDERLTITGFTCNESSGVKTESSTQKDSTVSLANFLSWPLRKGMDDSPVTCPKDEDIIMNPKMVKVYHHRKRISRISDTEASVGGANVKMETAQTMKSSGTECSAEIANNSSAIISSDQHGSPVTDHALVPIESSANIDKQHSVLVLKKTELSQAALRVLSQKREKLCNEQREIEDQIALCEKSIRRILDGKEDNLGLKVDTIIDCCSEVLFKDKTQVRDSSHLQAGGSGSIQCMRPKRLSEAVLFGQSACQELDDICCENNWLLPRYVVSASDGGFLAKVALKGIDFESSCESVLRSSPREARESAAAQMITKLRVMAGQTPPEGK